MGGIKKYSRKREAVLEKIRGTKSHPTADWVYAEVKKELPDISLGTVYRNLSVFKEEGLIISVGVVDGQERFDANTSEHTHFICLSCGEVLDIEADVDQELNERVARDNGLDILLRQLTFYGKCKKCSNKTKS
jgi:Fur family peroxide stress response transcriptional regulator